METTKLNRDFYWVVQVSSALSLGTLAGLLYSVRTVSPQIQFEFSIATMVAFALAAGLSIAFWHVAFQAGAAAEAAQAGSLMLRRRRRWLMILGAGFGVALVGAFAYPLRTLSADKVSEIGFGSLIAVIFLSLLGFIFWRVVCYLESDRSSGP